MVKRDSAWTEQDVIERLRGRVSLPRAAGLVLGIGDDCAIFRPRGSVEDLLFTTDMLIEGVHFRRETHTAADVGWKSLARGLSDIAAMGGEPRFCLLSLALPDWALPQLAGSRWLDGFYRGLLALAGSARAPLMGGDLARGDKLMADIVVCGTVPRGRALRRDGARPGDGIYVSGALGGSALGLATGRGQAGRGQSWKRHVHPEPRLALGKFLGHRLGATAAMDLSDGLSLDLHRLCLASGLEAEITEPPRFPRASLEQALHGGEDYELLFTVPAKIRPPRQFQGVPLTRIGTMRKGRKGAVTMNGAPLAPLGYDHFRDDHFRQP
jgi:thiamine-monophosphate kinase